MERNPMKGEAGRKRGGQKGNQNARKHGFYSRVLEGAERLDLELASDIDGIDDEIALLRVKIKSVLEKDPENVKLIMQATNILAGLVKTRYKITSEQKKGLRDAITNVVKDIAIPLGINIGSAAIGKRV
jgi:methyl coenzyme M reductase beta subunit